MSSVFISIIFNSCIDYIYELYLPELSLTIDVYIVFKFSVINNAAE